MYTKLKNSISLQLLKKVLVIYFSITFFITLSQILIEYYETQESVNQQLISLEENFKQSLQESIWDMNVAQTNSIVQSIYKLSFVKKVLITDANEYIISEAKEPTIVNEFVHEFNIYKKYESKTVLLAKVIIGSDQEKVIDIVKLGVYLILVNAIVKSALLSFLFITAFRKYLIIPLESFTDQISSIDFENMGTKKITINAPAQSELAYLEDRFNSMITTIEKQKEQIFLIKQKYLEKLEKKVKERTFELERSNLELSHMATTDYLTNVRNRRSFYDLAEQYFVMAKRNSQPLSILALDLDNFKSINDSYGHQVGDEVLKQFAKNCQQYLRESDIFGRMGGEEFTVALFDINYEDARIIANRIVKGISQLTIDNEGETITFTVSIGIACLKINDKTIDDIMHRADSALYIAKENGRNQVAG